MKLEIHSLYWPNYNRQMLEAHQKVMKFLDIPITYHERKINHGQWIDEVISSSDSDVV